MSEFLSMALTLTGAFLGCVAYGVLTRLISGVISVIKPYVGERGDTGFVD